MTRDALVVGGTRFIGRAVVEAFLAGDYAVTLCNRGRHDNPFADRAGVDHVTADRTDADELAAARDAVDPDVVVDMVAYHPADVRAATRVFADVDAYVYVSSGAAYGPEFVPKREDDTPLEPCSDAQATDDSMDSYGARKAEGDRAVFEAADDGVAAMSVRPPVVYGPHDYTGRFDYWVKRVRAHDRVLVPGDGTNLWHLVYVDTVADGIRTVAERGEAGEAYNVGDRRLLTLEELVETVAHALGTRVEVVTAGARELAAADLEPTDFPLYRAYPHVMSTGKLAALGWSALSPGDAVQKTVDHLVETGAAEKAPDTGPDRASEERVLELLDTV